jgi:hypothetical protein
VSGDLLVVLIWARWRGVSRALVVRARDSLRGTKQAKSCSNRGCWSSYRPLGKVTINDSTIESKERARNSPRSFPIPNTSCISDDTSLAGSYTYHRMCHQLIVGLLKCCCGEYTRN